MYYPSYNYWYQQDIQVSQLFCSVKKNSHLQLYLSVPQTKKKITCKNHFSNLKACIILINYTRRLLNFLRNIMGCQGVIFFQSGIAFEAAEKNFTQNNLIFNKILWKLSG